MARLPHKDHYTVDKLRALIITVWEFFGVLRGRCQHSHEPEAMLFQVQVTGIVQDVLQNWISDGPETGPLSRELAVAVTSWAIYGAAHFWAEKSLQGTSEELDTQALSVLQGIPPIDRLLY